MSTVIIGAGLAGLRTAAELRERGYSSPITILGAETHAPYDRPPLSSALLTDPEPVWLSEDLSIDWPAVADAVHLGVRATGIDVASSDVTVHTDTAGTFTARNVVIATGSHAINPWPGTLTLTTLDDAAALRLALASGATRVAIIGAGWIGVELAHALSAAGHAVTLLEAAAQPLIDHLGETGSYVRPWIEPADLRTGTTVTHVEVLPQGALVHTSSGEVSADVVITSIGVRPSTGWLEGSGIPLTERGFIPVSESGRVEGFDAGVWAVGDVATREHPVFGRVDGGHWFSALRDPAQVAAGILGQEIPRPAAPEVFSDQGKHHLEVLGSLAGTEKVLRGEVESGAWVEFHLRDGRLLGAVVANSPRDTSSIRRALSRGDLLEVTAGELADESVPLRRLLKR